MGLNIIRNRLRLFVWYLTISLAFAQTAPKAKTGLLNETITLSVETTTEDYFYTTTEVMNCEINGTCSTKAPNTTAPSMDPISKIPIKYKVEFSLNQEFCTCNMQDHICDINCCCDPDCTYSDRQIFSECEDQILHYDTRYCEFIKYIYMNNTPFEWHINQNGLFCVLKSNIPPYYIVQRKQPLESIDEAETERLNKFSWNKQLEKIPQFNDTNFQHGNPVWVIQKRKLKRLQLPNQFISNKCIIKEDIQNFKNAFYYCTENEIDEANEQLNMKTYFQDMFIVTTSIGFNRSSFKNQWLQNCPKNICLSILPKLCENKFVNCQNVSKNDTRISVKCTFLISKNMNLCENLVKRVQYNFYHNGSNGFTEIEALFVLQNFSEEFGTENLPEFLQEFSVNFWWNKKHQNYSSHFSGNPGYKTGKPILTGTEFNFGNKTHLDLKIKRNGSIYEDNFLTLPENVNGNCVSDNITILTVEFGYNLLTKCKEKNSIIIDAKHMYNETRKTKTGNETRTLVNASTICRDIQKNTFKLWKTQHNKRIGMFGNADPNNMTDWIAVMYKDHPSTILNNTTGQLIADKGILECSNLLNQQKIGIYHSKVDFKNIRNQEKILGVLYEFDIEDNIFVYDKKSNLVHFELDLESQVVFYDITVPKEKKVVDPPILKIKLPYDFFYPFIRIDNSAGESSLNHYLVFNAVLFVVLCNGYF